MVITGSISGFWALANSLRQVWPESATSLGSQIWGGFRCHGRVCAQVRALGQTSLLWKRGCVTIRKFTSVKKYHRPLGTANRLHFRRGMRPVPLVACLAHLTDQVDPTNWSYQLSHCGQEGDFSKKCFRDIGMALGLPEHTNTCLFYESRHYN